MAAVIRSRPFSDTAFVVSVLPEKKIDIDIENANVRALTAEEVASLVRLVNEE